MTAYPGSYPAPSAYTSFSPGGQRPGIVTAIGIVSVIVAGICLAGGVFGGLWTMVMYRGAQAVATASGASARAASGASLPALALPTPEELEADAESRRAARLTRRTGLIELLEAVRPLTPAVREQIDGMLARHAERVLPKALLRSSEVTTAELRTMISSMGSMPPVQAGDSEGVFFQFTETGRLEAYGNRVVFKPSDGGSTLRTSGPATAAEEDAAIAAASAPSIAAPATQGIVSPKPLAFQIHPSGMNSQEVQTVVQKAQAATGGKLNQSQLNSITSELQTLSPPLVKSQMVYSPIRLATVQPDGQALVVFSDGMLAIDAAGMIVQQSTNDISGVTIDPVGLTLLIGESIAALLLAAFLLVAGILVLRNSPRSQAFLWAYAIVKLPMALLGGVAFAWVMGDVVSGISRASGGTSIERMTGFAVFIGAAGAIYPVALMITLSTPTVREYFAAERAR